MLLQVEILEGRGEGRHVMMWSECERGGGGGGVMGGCGLRVKSVGDGGCVVRG